MWIDLDRAVLSAVAALSLGVVVTCAGPGEWRPEPGHPERAAGAAEPEPAGSSAPAGSVLSTPSAPAPSAAAATAAPGAAPAVRVSAPEALELIGFYQGLRELAEGRRKEHVRVLWLGDSHTAADYMTGAVRRDLQKRFGAGGPGYVRVGVGSYRHGAAKISRDGPFHVEPNPPPRRSRQDDGVFGLGGMRAIAEAPAHARVELGRDALHGTARWSVLFSPERGAALEIALGEQKLVVPPAGSAGSAQAPGIQRVTLVAEPSKPLDLTALRGKLRLFGVIAEGEKAGVVLDALGIDGARIATALAWDDAAFVAEVAARKPDLAVIAYGTNEAFDRVKVERYVDELGELVGRLRRGRPEIDCVILAPPDAGAPEGGSPPRLVEIERAQRDAAQKLGCGFFSLRLAMGGEGSYWQWVRETPPLARPDRLHYTPKGYERLGAAFAGALLEAYERRR